LARTLLNGRAVEDVPLDELGRALAALHAIDPDGHQAGLRLG
jgi:aminoglycoside phosphotransferase (APT) family kinase protein